MTVTKIYKNVPGDVTDEMLLAALRQTGDSKYFAFTDKTYKPEIDKMRQAMEVTRPKEIERIEVSQIRETYFVIERKNNHIRIIQDEQDGVYIDSVFIDNENITELANALLELGRQVDKTYCKYCKNMSDDTIHDCNGNARIGPNKGE